jgi:quinol monooxygenase YgiN
MFPPAEQVTVVAFLPAKPGRSDELDRRLLNVYEQARVEDGNINYDLHQPTEDPPVWILYERCG